MQDDSCAGIIDVAADALGAQSLNSQHRLGSTSCEFMRPYLRSPPDEALSASMLFWIHFASVPLPMPGAYTRFHFPAQLKHYLWATRVHFAA